MKWRRVREIYMQLESRGGTSGRHFGYIHDTSIVIVIDWMIFQIAHSLTILSIINLQKKEQIDTLLFSTVIC